MYIFMIFGQLFLIIGRLQIRDFHLFFVFFTSVGGSFSNTDISRADAQIWRFWHFLKNSDFRGFRGLTVLIHWVKLQIVLQKSFRKILQIDPKMTLFSIFDTSEKQWFWVIFLKFSWFWTRFDMTSPVRCAHFGPFLDFWHFWPFLVLMRPISGCFSRWFWTVFHGMSFLALFAKNAIFEPYHGLDMRFGVDLGPKSRS